MSTDSRAIRWSAVLALVVLVGCDAGAGSGHRVGDAYERNNMPSASPDRPAGPHSLNTDNTGDFQALHPNR